MSYTIRQLFIDVLNYVVRHPRALTVPNPIHRSAIASAYETTNGIGTFEPAIIAQARALDADVTSLSDSDLLASLYNSVGADEDISGSITLPGGD